VCVSTEAVSSSLDVFVLPTNHERGRRADPCALSLSRGRFGRLARSATSSLLPRALLGHAGVGRWRDELVRCGVGAEGLRRVLMKSPPFCFALLLPVAAMCSVGREEKRSKQGQRSFLV